MQFFSTEYAKSQFSIGENKSSLLTYLLRLGIIPSHPKDLSARPDQALHLLSLLYSLVQCQNAAFNMKLRFVKIP